MPIFYNKYLKIGGSCFFYKAWFDKGVRFIMDLIDNQGNFFSFNQFLQRTLVTTNFIQYQGVIECIKKLLRDTDGNLNSGVQGPIIPKVCSTLLKQKKGSQNIYNILNQNKDTPSGKTKWNQLYHIEEESWEYIFQAPFQITKCTKLRWFQTSINHRILVTNKFLHQIHIIDNSNCTFCGNCEETISHLFWSCSKTQLFLQDLAKRFKEMNIQLNLNEINFILGLYPKTTSETIQFLMLIAKYYINMCRCTQKPLNFIGYKINVQSLYQSHKEIALNNNDIQNFLKAWNPFQQLIG